MNANYPGLLKYTYKKKKSISTSLNPHLLLVPLRNKDEEEWSGMFLKWKNNRDGLMRSPWTQDNQIDIQTAPLRKGAQGPHFCWGGRRSAGTLCVRVEALATVIATAAAAKSLQLCLPLCDPIDGSPPGSPVPGILQARTLEWVTISFSNAWKWKVKVKSLSHVQPSATPWTAAYQAPPSMGFSRQEYWSGVPLPSPQSLPTC